MINNHVLITGGAGFIGSHLSRHLLEGGHFVTVVDNMLTGRRANIADIAENPNFVIRNADICDPRSTEDLTRVTHIVHLACPASPKANSRWPLDTIRASCVGTLNILELAEHTKARVVCASSSEIYGDPLVHPQAESYRGNCDPIGPFSAYTEGKRVLEAACAAHRRLGTNVGIIRPFNVFGPGMWPDDGRVMSNFCARALRGETLEIAGGHQTRSFCYIDDFVDGLVKMMESSSFGPINLGDASTEITIAELAELVVNSAGIGQVKLTTGRVGDTHRRQPDISLAKRVLDWTPTTSLAVGIEKTLRWMADILPADRAVR
ncbi:NAD-dependent epimerase/dehydratase family protein [Nocardia sp. CDC160]|uniref:NAD-dependent epimerase/dehydratase family protein n=1 Tax=Nocardia sp. CDC160 TaxID=3112166 RepID=UPI002DB9EA4E|nr:NAD-dependent epimerase/dehydratase family protein [Nocardia sp. CDC160]MEC3915527.1 NAD-dependent epimerase/dehydratase family protein [Nocardia sp. CDC160]